MLGEIIGLWCNGNTTVFGAVFLGSSPSRPTNKSQLFGWDFLFQLGEKFIPILREVLVDQQTNPNFTVGIFCF